MYYRPEDAAAADVIPFYREKAFQLFYLKDYRNIEKCGEGVPWYLLESKDLVHFEDKGEVIARGGQEDQDLYVFTGGVYEKDGINYIFYTGHNPHFIEQGKKQEVILLACSTDFKTWQKDKEFRLSAPNCFEPHDFRDPFVFYNEETKEYNMLLAARISHGPDRRRGCTAVAVSQDLKTWRVKEEPFYSPGLYHTHECPDLFRMGDWWYLVFSEFSEKCVTRYRMSRTLGGPWLTPENDTFDNRNFYAAKTVSDGSNRYIFGWNPTNTGDRDFAEAQWGGNIITHKIVQEKDGCLFVDVPDKVRDYYSMPLGCQEGHILGKVKKCQNGWRIGRKDGFSSLDLGELKEECRLSFDLSIQNGVQNFYLFLNSDKNNEAAYYVGIDPLMGRMTFDRWPRKRNDHPFMLELERRVEVLPEKKYHVEVIVDGPVLEVYFGGRSAMSARMNDFGSGSFGFAISFGEACIENLKYMAPGK